MAARVAQSAVQLIINSNPNARVAQSVVQLILVPAPPPPVAGTPAPFSGGAGFRPAACGCSPEVFEAERVRILRARRGAWPYPDIFPPAGDTVVNERRSIAAPALGATAVVLAYNVPSGRRLILQGILQVYTGGAFVPGDALWTVDVDTPVGVANIQALPVQGLVNVPFPLGSDQLGTFWPFQKPYVFGPLSLVQSKVTNVNLGGGAFTSAFVGFLESVFVPQ